MRARRIVRGVFVVVVVSAIACLAWFGLAAGCDETFAFGDELGLLTSGRWRFAGVHEIDEAAVDAWIGGREFEISWDGPLPDS